MAPVALPGEGMHGGVPYARVSIERTSLGREVGATPIDAENNAPAGLCARARLIPGSACWGVVCWRGAPSARTICRAHPVDGKMLPWHVGRLIREG